MPNSTSQHANISIQRVFLVIVAGVVFLSLAACGGGGGGGSDDTVTAPNPPSPTTPTNATPQLLSDPIPEPIEIGSISVDAVNFLRLPQTEDVAGSPINTNQAYARVQYMIAAPDESGRLFINDVRGVLYVTDTEGSAVQVYLDLREEDVALYPNRFPNESGFLGFALHPDFGNEGEAGYGKLYTAFSANPDSGTADWVEEQNSLQESVLMEWSAQDASANVFTGSKRELLRVGQFAANHNIGNLAFNPTAERGSADYGNLYLTIGDGGSAHDPRNYGQNDKVPLGTMLRINPLETEAGDKYGIPSDNPFVGGEDGFSELWAYGLRHPQHFSWDANGRMFLIDIGQDMVEEVNIGVAGSNYGWRQREGTFATAMAFDSITRNGPVYERPDDDDTSYVYPVAQYDHDEGYAIGSGFAYQGSAIPELQGKYVFADIVRGRVFYIDTTDLVPDEPADISELKIYFDSEDVKIEDIAGIANTYISGEQRVDLRLSVDAAHELYILTKGDGWIRKLAPLNSSTN